jgi:polyhydroxyalkanoate synthesis regulator phasin
MDQAGSKTDFYMWLRRVWTATIRAAEALERSPIEELFDRIDRLEREVAMLKKQGVATK